MTDLHIHLNVHGSICSAVLDDATESQQVGWMLQSRTLAVRKVWSVGEKL